MVSSLFWRYKMKKIRELRADEIEVRVGIVKKNGISLLLYKDARCDSHVNCSIIHNSQDMETT